MKYLFGLAAFVVLANVAHAGVTEFCFTDWVTGQYYCGSIDDGSGMGEG